ncbi:unnamed protein product [Cylicocyclus nassatus]|uniref:Uncharacterized protein n=1 Tax=Cylicocyclus nassatus TaxID=53992 RepID=A0AA36DPY6_CYLNA|nr:unnamed protein product [Cylicocyclus nassatus]
MPLGAISNRPLPVLGAITLLANGTTVGQRAPRCRSCYQPRTAARGLKKEEDVAVGEAEIELIRGGQIKESRGSKRGDATIWSGTLNTQQSTTAAHYSYILLVFRQ